MVATVVVIGGCAAEAIKRGLSSSPVACAQYRFVDLPVHRVSLEDASSLELIGTASHIFAQQIGGTDWALIGARAASGCKVVPFPDVALRSLWPFDSNYGPADTVAQAMHEPPIRHFDGALARLREMEPDKAKRIRRYRDLDFPWASRIKIVAEAQRRFLAHVDTLSNGLFGSFIGRHFQDRQLFYNAAHPSAAYFLELCSYCWRVLDLPGAPGHLRGIDSWRDWSVPVHPGIAERLGVTWATESKRYYYCTLGDLTWREWVETYVESFG